MYSTWSHKVVTLASTLGGGPTTLYMLREKTFPQFCKRLKMMTAQNNINQNILFQVTAVQCLTLSQGEEGGHLKVFPKLKHSSHLTNTCMGHHLSWTYPYFTRGEQINATLSLLSFYVQDRCCSHREWASLSWLRTQNHDSIGSKTSGFVGRFSFKYHSIIVQKNWECSVTNANGHKLNANPGILSL